MNLNFKKVDIILSPQQEEGYLKKIEEVCRFLKDICPAGSGDLELGRITMHHQTGDVYFAKVRLDFPGLEFYVEQKGSNLDEAFNAAKDHLEEEIRRQKEKFLTDRRKIGRVRRLMKSFRFWDKR